MAEHGIAWQDMTIKDLIELSELAYNALNINYLMKLGISEDIVKDQDMIVSQREVQW
jgi:hypothetical protein